MPERMSSEEQAERILADPKRSAFLLARTLLSLWPKLDTMSPEDAEAFVDSSVPRVHHSRGMLEYGNKTYWDTMLDMWKNPEFRKFVLAEMKPKAKVKKAGSTMAKPEFVAYVVSMSGNEQFPNGGVAHKLSADEVRDVLTPNDSEEWSERWDDKGLTTDTEQFILDDVLALPPGGIAVSMPSDMSVVAIARMPVKKSEIMTAIREQLGENGDEDYEESVERAIDALLI